MALNSDFWNKKKVFLTGHTGFKGSWLALWLQKLGAEVHGFALQPPTTPNLFELAEVGHHMQSIHGDIRDYRALREALCGVKPDIVLHLAAQAIVRQSYEDPIETFASNVMGTAHLLEAVRQCDSIRVALCITSDKCYENREWPWGYRETDPMGGYDPYSASKGCSEIIAAAYRRSFFHHPGDGHGAAVATARAGNVIGGGDWAQDRLVPDIMQAFVKNEEVVIRHPTAIRPWQHVLDPLNGYMRLAEKLWQSGSEFADGWNFGPSDEGAGTVEFIVEQLARLWGPDASWRLSDKTHPHEAHYLKLDCSKARNLLQWRPRLLLPQVLDWTVQWYKAYQQRDNMNRLTLAQISQYEKLSEK